MTLVLWHHAVESTWCFFSAWISLFYIWIVQKELGSGHVVVRTEEDELGCVSEEEEEVADGAINLVPLV